MSTKKVVMVISVAVTQGMSARLRLRFCHSTSELNTTSTKVQKSSEPSMPPHKAEKR